jgi:hypothetical protein
MITAPDFTVAEVLEATADRIERLGWTHGPFIAEHTDKCCIITGAPFATQRSAAFKFLAKWLGGDPDSPAGFLIDWNDTPGRTQEEVLTALRAAAQAARIVWSEAAE